MKRNTALIEKADEMTLLSPSDIMTLFNIGKNNAYALMNSESFPSIRINRKIYVEKRKLKKWLDTYEGRSYEY